MSIGKKRKNIFPFNRRLSEKMLWCKGMLSAYLLRTQSTPKNVNKLRTFLKNSQKLGNVSKNSKNLQIWKRKKKNSKKQSPVLSLGRNHYEFSLLFSPFPLIFHFFAFHQIPLLLLTTQEGGKWSNFNKIGVIYTRSRRQTTGSISSKDLAQWIGWNVLLNDGFNRKFRTDTLWYCHGSPSRARFLACEYILDTTNQSQSHCSQRWKDQNQHEVVSFSFNRKSIKLLFIFSWQNNNTNFW